MWSNFLAPPIAAAAAWLICCGTALAGPTTYDVDYRLQYSSRTAITIDKLTVYAPIPPTRANQRLVGRIQVMAAPHIKKWVDASRHHPLFRTVEIQPTGQKALLFSFGKLQLAAGKQQEIRIRYKVALDNPALKRSAMKKVIFARLDDKQLRVKMAPFLKASFYVESDNDTIKGALPQVLKRLRKGPRSSVYPFAEKIFDWLVDNCEYKYTFETITAKDMLAKRKGHCGSYAALFTAFSRNLGIPARMRNGFWDGHNQVHTLAEFYLPGVGWVPADAALENANGFAERNKHLKRHVCLTMTGDNRHDGLFLGFLSGGAFFTQPRSGSFEHKYDVKITKGGKR